MSGPSGWVGCPLHPWQPRGACAHCPRDWVPRPVRGPIEFRCNRHRWLSQVSICPKCQAEPKNR